MTKSVSPSLNMSANLRSRVVSYSIMRSGERQARWFSTVAFRPRVRGEGVKDLVLDFGFFFVFGLHLLKHVKELFFGKDAFIDQQLGNRVDLNRVGH